MNLENLEPKEWLSMNAKLQAKKNKARQLIKDKGIIEKKGFNSFSKYKYITEAQYKEIANEILTEAKLEITMSEINNIAYEGSSKMPFGRKVLLNVKLQDTETGFYEESRISGEGMDNGDKGIYKAYTGAFKYFMANNFLVPTGDDPEKDEKTTPNKKAEEISNEKVTLPMAKTIQAKMEEADLTIQQLQAFSKVEKIADLTVKQFQWLMDNWGTAVEKMRTAVVKLEDM